MTPDLERFGGIARLYGLAALEAFAQSHLAIVGIGGVGGWAAEALARSGVGHLTLIDLDDVCLTNLNRQVHATTESVGKPKIEVMASRLKEINPAIELTLEHSFLTSDNITTLLPETLNGILDCIDSMRPKCALLAHCFHNKLSAYSSGGAGGRLSPQKINTTDLAHTHGCSLLGQVRKNLRQHYGFPSGGAGKAKPFGISAVFSSEQPRFPTSDGCTSHERPDDLPSGLRCDAGYGTSTPVIGTFGLTLAQIALADLADLANFGQSLP